MLLVSELKLFIENLPQMLSKVQNFELTEGTAKLVNDKALFQPTDVEQNLFFWSKLGSSETIPNEL